MASDLFTAAELRRVRIKPEMLAAPLTGFGVDVGGETSFPGD